MSDSDEREEDERAEVNPALDDLLANSLASLSVGTSKASAAPVDVITEALPADKGACGQLIYPF